MSGPAPGPRLSRLPILWASASVVLLGLVFLSVSWSYNDVHNMFKDAEALDWRQSLRFAFGRDVEYRPLLTLGVKASYELFGLRLWFYHGVVLILFGLVLAQLVWIFRSAGLRRGLAASIALSCVVGLHTSRILFANYPLNSHSGGLVFILLAVGLSLDARARAVDWVLLPVTLASLLLIEAGLLIAPLVLVLWWFEAPGISLRGVAATAVATGTYLLLRFLMGTGGVVSVYTGSGLGFSELTPEDLRNVFERAPWLFWIYNLVASLLTVLFSEPRAGVYRFVWSLLRGGADLWQWLHVGSSALTTVVVGVALAAYRPASTRDRLLVISGLVLVVAGSGLGMLYTRDRIGLYAGVGYGLLVYVALSSVLERLPAPGWRRLATLGVVGAIGCAWTVRVVEAGFQLRDTAWDYRFEWTDRYEELGGAAQPQTPLLLALRTEALRRTPPDPRLDPAWTYLLFERRFSRRDPSRRMSPDGAADRAVRPLSAPFDVRWVPGVDDAARLRLETALGLAEARPVERDPSGRTWSYRLRQPTRERVRSILMNASVEDTARIDTNRFEVSQ